MTDLDERVAALEGRMEGQVQVIDQRFTQIDHRFTALEAYMNQRFDQIDRRFLHLEDKMFGSSCGWLASRSRPCSPSWPPWSRS